MAKKIDSQLGRDYLWNTASSIIGSASMVIMALVVSRFLGGYAAGVFTLATAAGQQFQTLGAYEVRPYQATDVRHRFSFPTYFATVSSPWLSWWWESLERRSGRDGPPQI